MPLARTSAKQVHYVTVCMRVFVCLLMFISSFISFSFTNISFSDHYFVCAIGGQHDGHL